MRGDHIFEEIHDYDIQHISKALHHAHDELKKRNLRLRKEHKSVLLSIRVWTDNPSP